jgi:predicted Zn-dependent protease
MLAAGNAKSAEDTLAEAFRLFPDSQFASRVMADAQAANGNFKEAARLLDECYRATPSAANLYRWANALARAGENQKAAEAFAKFEKQARSEINQAYNANPQLIEFYSEHKSDPAEALRIATLESSKRQDCATMADLAWALYRNGKFVEA